VACLPFGIAETGMKNMVLVPGIVSLPWARQWISVGNCQRSLSELWLSSLYLASSPVSGLKAFPWSAMKWTYGSGKFVWLHEGPIIVPSGVGINGGAKVA